MKLITKLCALIDAVFFAMRVYRRDADFVATSCTPIPRESTECGVAKLHNKRVDRSKTDITRFYRREAVVLQNKKNGRFAVVRVQGVGPSVEGLDFDGVALDYDTRDELGVDKGECEIIVRRATDLDLMLYTWSDPDPFRRATWRIAIVGLVLSVVGTIMIFVPLH